MGFYIKNFIKNIKYSLFKFNKFFFTSKPLKDKQYYFKLYENAKKAKFPLIDKLEENNGFKINRDWLDDLALSTQIVIKKSKLNYQHGRLLYSHLRKYISDRNIFDINILETGTSRGFSSICMAKALNDSKITGKIVTFDIIPHNQKMYWNIFKDHKSMLTREELLSDWSDELNKIIFIEGWTNRQLEKTGLKRIHFAFLDAQHEYSNVMQEFYYVQKRQLVKDIIIFDDVTENKFDGVVKAVYQIKDEGNYSVDFIKSSEQRAYAIATKIK